MSLVTTTSVAKPTLMMLHTDDRDDLGDERSIASVRSDLKKNTWREAGGQGSLPRQKGSEGHWKNNGNLNRPWKPSDKCLSLSHECSASRCFETLDRLRERKKPSSPKHGHTQRHETSSK